jgi:N-acetylmuramoyl-L-alanine amidase
MPPKIKETADTSAKEDEKDIKKEEKKESDNGKKELKPAVVEAVKPPVIKEKEKDAKEGEKKEADTGKKDIKSAVVEAVKPPVVKEKEKDAKDGEKKEVDTGKKEINPVVSEPVKSVLIYKVQILSSDKKIPLNSAKFKNVEKPGEYMDKGIYKYTSGEFANKEDAVKLQSELIKNGFKDAFVILTQDGKRITQK